MQDARPRLRETEVIELQLVSRFGKRAYRGVPQEGTLFSVPGTENLPKNNNNPSAQVTFLPGALIWVSTGKGSEPGNRSPSRLWHMLTLEERR